MRKILVILLALVAVTASNCGNGTGKDSAGIVLKTDGTGKGEIIFREYQHDFGKVAEGEKISYKFVFDNKGTENIIISSATTTCGCTIPKYDTKPIPPGANGNLEVVFDTSGKNGMQTKTVTVKSNASKPVVLLKITAEVVTTSK
jgi:Protein of unknown function (DUF1573)